ncbi:MAG TPA: hypothetical protein VLH85_03555 [Levilinea sp.]|nr:hypothetical protein [Levilinea sp.]
MNENQILVIEDEPSVGEVVKQMTNKPLYRLATWQLTRQLAW